MDKLLSSKFVVIDGLDGCGKSTQTELLSEWLVQQGIEVVRYRDPGTTAIGEQIRNILLDPVNKKMDTRTELLLYMAARAQLWAEKISPSLDLGKWVVLDRWLSSTCAYQGFAGGFGIENVISIAEDSLKKTWPDLTIILDVDLETAKPRLDDKPDRMEQKGDAYHEKVRQGFLELAKNRDGFAVVDASGTIENVHNQLLKVIKDNFGT